MASCYRVGTEVVRQQYWSNGVGPAYDNQGVWVRFTCMPIYRRTSRNTLSNLVKITHSSICSQYLQTGQVVSCCIRVSSPVLTDNKFLWPRSASYAGFARNLKLKRPTRRCFPPPVPGPGANLPSARKYHRLHTVCASETLLCLPIPVCFRSGTTRATIQHQ